MTSLVKNAICGDGVSAEVLFYAFLQKQSSDEVLFEVNGYTPVKPVTPFALIDDLGYLNNCNLELYAVKLTEFPKNFEAYLEACFERLANLGASAYWAMFDGVFHYEYLLTADVANKVYGFGVNGQCAQIAIQDDIIMGDAWTKKLEDFKNLLVDMKLVNRSPAKIKPS